MGDELIEKAQELKTMIQNSAEYQKYDSCRHILKKMKNYTGRSMNSGRRILNFRQRVLQRMVRQTGWQKHMQTCWGRKQ